MNAHFKRTGPAIESPLSIPAMARSIGTRMSAPSSVGSAIDKPIDVLSRFKSTCI